MEKENKPATPNLRDELLEADRRRKPATPKLGKPRKTKTPVVDAVKTRCPKCESTDRTEYSGTKTRDIAGRLPDGTEYQKIHWRRCRCGNCGQARVDREFA